MNGPKNLLFNIQLLSFGDDFAKKYAVKSKKGVVGRPGSSIPQRARNRKINPNTINIAFLMKRKYNSLSIQPFTALD